MATKKKKKKKKEEARNEARLHENQASSLTKFKET